MQEVDLWYETFDKVLCEIQSPMTGYTCDECFSDPIIGPRYHCNVREDYDLCETCEMKKTNCYSSTRFDRDEDDEREILSFTIDGRKAVSDFVLAIVHDLVSRAFHKAGGGLGLANIRIHVLNILEEVEDWNALNCNTMANRVLCEIDIDLKKYNNDNSSDSNGDDDNNDDKVINSDETEIEADAGLRDIGLIFNYDLVRAIAAAMLGEKIETIEEEAAVALATISEYICVEVSEMSSKIASDNNATAVGPSHVKLCIETNTEFKNLWNVLSKSADGECMQDKKEDEEKDSASFLSFSLQDQDHCVNDVDMEMPELLPYQSLPMLMPPIAPMLKQDDDNYNGHDSDDTAVAVPSPFVLYDEVLSPSSEAEYDSASCKGCKVNFSENTESLGLGHCALCTIKNEVNQLKETGNAFFREGSMREALQYYDQAIMLLPYNDEGKDNVALYSNRSSAHLKAGNMMEALKDAKKCISLSPEWSKGYYRLGVAQQTLKMHVQSMQSFEKAIDMHDLANAKIKQQQDTALVNAVKVAIRATNKDTTECSQDFFENCEERYWCNRWLSLVTKAEGNINLDGDASANAKVKVIENKMLLKHITSFASDSYLGNTFHRIAVLGHISNVKCMTKHQNILFVGGFCTLGAYNLRNNTRSGIPSFSIQTGHTKDIVKLLVNCSKTSQFTHLLSASADHTIRVWDLVSTNAIQYMGQGEEMKRKSKRVYECIQVLADHEAGILDIVLSESLIFSSDSAGNIRGWKREYGYGQYGLMFALAGKVAVKELLVADNRLYSASGDNFTCWSIEVSEDLSTIENIESYEMEGQEDAVTVLLPGPPGTELLYTGNNEGIIRVWKTNASNQEGSAQLLEEVWGEIEENADADAYDEGDDSTDFSEDGVTFIYLHPDDTLENQIFYSAHQGGMVRVWEWSVEDDMHMCIKELRHKQYNCELIHKLLIHDGKLYVSMCARPQSAAILTQEFCCYDTTRDHVEVPIQKQSSRDGSGSGSGSGSNDILIDGDRLYSMSTKNRAITVWRIPSAVLAPTTTIHS
jgi:WD40 repeat protein/tetratricopeptide (TPR) repeat protein